MNTDFDALKEYLPLLLPLIVAELALFVWALVHVLTHKTYKRGNRVLWLIVVIVMMNFGCSMFNPQKDRFRRRSRLRATLVSQGLPADKLYHYPSYSVFSVI